MNTPYYSIHDTTLILHNKSADGTVTIGVRPLFHRLLNLLQERGFTTGPDITMGKTKFNPRSLSWQVVYGKCRDLHMTLEYTQFQFDHKNLQGRIKFEFWQELVIDPDRKTQPWGGKYSFHKLELMPIHVRAHMEATHRAIITMAQAFGFVPDARLCARKVTSTGMTWLREYMEDSWRHHLRGGSYDPAMLGTNVPSYNCTSRDKATLRPGQTVYFYGPGQRLHRGTAYYGFNSSWWVICNERTRPHCCQASDLYTTSQGLTRRKTFTPKERAKKLQRVYMRHIDAEDWHLCQKIKPILAQLAV